MPAFRAAYLIHGDDHGRVAERRARLRAMAEAESGPGGVEVFEGEASTPEAVAGALNAMTFAVGRRFVVADGVERWKDAEVAPVVDAIGCIDPETLTVAFFAREDARLKVPASLLKAVTAAGGAVAEESALKPKQLPGWVLEQARGLGLQMDVQAARALIARVGDRQQRLLRELEKLALELGPGATLGAEEVEGAAATSAEKRVWTLADCLVAGDRAGALRAFVELRGQGERLPGLLFGMVRRLRDAHEIAVALEAGEAPARIRGRLRMPSFAADRLIADVRRRDAETYRRALELLADLELESRGGKEAVLNEDTAAVRAVIAIGG
jgi:DNA polymerase-3 subunit delta